MLFSIFLFVMMDSKKEKISHAFSDIVSLPSNGFGEFSYDLLCKSFNRVEFEKIHNVPYESSRYKPLHILMEKILTDRVASKTLNNFVDYFLKYITLFGIYYSKNPNETFLKEIFQMIDTNIYINLTSKIIMELPEIMKNKDIIKSVQIIDDINEIYNLFTDFDTEILFKNYTFLCERNNQKARSENQVNKINIPKPLDWLFNITNIDLAYKLRFEHVLQ
ncbi:hypothetical protein HZS_5991 [Henneguya salminicola]|nr:hypothetical protein HZS_5991 [Henneguya salminicola]